MTVIRIPLWLQSLLVVVLAEATYFSGIVTEEESLAEAFGSLTASQVMGAVVTLCIAMGVTATTRPQDPSVLVRYNGHGYEAGEASRLENGTVLDPQRNLDSLEVKDPHSIPPNHTE